MPAFEGSWTYRSYVNDPDQNIEPNRLLFGTGTLVLAQPEPGRIGGTLGGAGWSIDLGGDVIDGDPTRLRWQGRGEINGEIWVYDYLGYGSTTTWVMSFLTGQMVSIKGIQSSAQLSELSRIQTARRWQASWLRGLQFEPKQQCADSQFLH